MYKKGSITVYLSLMLLILLSLSAAALYSGQSAGVRMQAVHAADQGMYSLFSRYCIPMLERYHMFFLDGTFGGETLKMGRVYGILEKDTAMVLTGANAMPGKNGLIDELKLEKGSVTGYTLATDNGGNAVKSQAVAYMETVLGVQGVRSLIEKVKQEEVSIEDLEEDSHRVDEAAVWEVYETVRENSRELSGEEQSVLEIPEDYEDPVQAVKDAKERGILNLVIPDGDSLSTQYYPVSDRVSVRNLEQGLGVSSFDPSCDSRKSDLLFGEYLMRHFGCYTKHTVTDGLQYQLEYVIQGKSSDRENLRGVVNRLLMIREVSNLQYLYSNAVKRAEAKSAATVLATVCMVPEAAGTLEHVLLFCWAFGESVLDIRELLNGGQVPLMKNEDSWRSKLWKLPDILRGGTAESSGGDGMTYQEYLRVLLLMKSSDEKVLRCMDMMEQGVRADSKNAAFRMDACIYTMEVQFQFQTKHGLSYEALRKYGYDME